jgi:hypothetical protein
MKLHVLGEDVCCKLQWTWVMQQGSTQLEGSRGETVHTQKARL